MPAQFTVEEIITATRGRLVSGERARKIRRVVINSRQVRPGDLFIAIKGHRLDGHKFIRAAVRRGARAVLVSRSRVSVPAAVTVIRVKDTTRALGLLARHHRERFTLPVIGITGSTGKTTTKEMIAAVLRPHFRVLVNKGTENNQIGVPLTLLNLKSSHQIVVIELGTNCPGDIAWLTDIAQPTVAVFTNIGNSHLELLKSPAKVFLEKVTLAKGMKPKGTIIFNKDDHYLQKIPRIIKNKKLVTYGIAARADVRAGAVSVGADRKAAFLVKGRHKFVLGTPAVSNVLNALAAICCGRLFNISYNNININIRRCPNPPGRQSVERVEGCWVINDSYNANPLSFYSALKTLSVWRTRGRRILVCGDMLELGPQAKRLHEKVGKAAADAGVDLILSLGPMARHIGKAAKKRNRGISVYHGRKPSCLHSRILQYACPGDVFLVKGSRGMKMERTVQFLREKFKKGIRA